MVDRKRSRYTEGGDTHALGLERFKLAASAYDKQQQRELDDLKFAARKNQWTDAEREVRKGFITDGMTIADRPTMIIDKLRQPIQQLENQQRQANLAVDVHPESLDADRATADAIQGIYRHIQVTSRADQIARFWAYSRAIKCGRGVYAIRKAYCHPYAEQDDPARFDQEIRISRILNQAGVLFDPFAQEPDWSDGEYAFEKNWIPRRRYAREHPDSALSDEETDFAVIGTACPGWIKTGETKESDAVLEVTYWRVVYDDEETRTAGGGEGDELDTKADDYQERKVRKRRVFCCKMNAKETYDEVEWDTDDIPLVPVIANEENLDGERIWEGMVAPAKDSQRTYNALTSAFVETVAMAPKAPWVATIEQIGPYKAWWNQSNVRNFPFLPYVARSEGGQQLPPPQRLFGEPPIQAIAQGIHQFDANINATTGFFDPSRGNLSSGERSGVALQALQKQTETGNSGYLDNLAQISMTRESQIVLKLIPKVYDRPGRIVSLLGADNQRSQAMVGVPFVKGPDGRPMPSPPGANPEDVQTLDLAKGAYSSVVTIGKASATAAAEGSEAMGALLQAEPQLLQYIGDLYFKYQDWPGAQQIAERFKKLLPPQLQDQQDGQTTQQLQQQLQQAQQQLQQLQPLADANQAKLQQAQLDAKAKVDAAQIDAQTKQQIAQAQEETKRLIAQLQLEMTRLKAFADSQNAAGKAQADIQQTVMQENAETERQRIAQAHEAALAAADASHEAGQQTADLHHERVMGDTAHVQSLELQRAKPKTNGSGA